MSVAMTDAELGSHVCTCCGGTMEVFFEQANVPVNSCILVDDRDTARSFPTGEIRLGFCSSCGFIRNLAFDPKLTEYSGRYEETQAYSPTFNKFHQDLAQRLVDGHDVRGKRVVEIGCGKGEFLALVCELGNNEGLGYDPSYDPDRGVLGGLSQVRVEREFFDADSGKQDADVVICKMTLEHIEKCADFVGAARNALRPAGETLAFFQVPESMRILKDCAFEDIYYEHCSYFTPGSAARLFRAAGFQVDRIDVTYAGQYLTLVASNGVDGQSAEPLPIEESVAETASHVASFAARYEEQRQAWTKKVAGVSNGPAVIWGSGSKGVSFLRTLDDSESVAAAVDINPNRQGKFMLGTGIPIISPEELQALRPGLVVVMNSIYEEEIAASLQTLGVETELASL